MKFFIDSKTPIAEQTDIEREMPARMQVADLIAKKFRTDLSYFYADRVGMIFIVDLDDAEQLSEIILLLRRAGLVPEAYPVITGRAMHEIMLDVASIE